MSVWNAGLGWVERDARLLDIALIPLLLLVEMDGHGEALPEGGVADAGHCVFVYAIYACGSWCCSSFVGTPSSREKF